MGITAQACDDRNLASVPTRDLIYANGRRKKTQDGISQNFRAPPPSMGTLDLAEGRNPPGARHRSPKPGIKEVLTIDPCELEHVTPVTDRGDSGGRAVFPRVGMGWAPLSCTAVNTRIEENMPPMCPWRYFWDSLGTPIPRRLVRTQPSSSSLP